MLIKYEFEILSYMASNAIRKSSNILYIPFNRIKNLDENIDTILNRLEDLEIIEKNDTKVEINIDSWINKFIELLKSEFEKNKMNIECLKNTSDKEIIFNMNGINKHIKLQFDKNYSKYEDLIFMFPIEYDQGIYWMDLFNDINTLHMFYSYLINEVNSINTYEYKQINIFEGLEDNHVSEIFNVSIKSYLKNKSKYISDADKETVKITKKLLRKEEVNCYRVDIYDYDLIVIKDEKIIKFLTFKDDNLVYVREIDDLIIDIRDKLVDKVSEYRKLVMFRDNKVIDNSMKLTNGASKMLLPTSIIVSILSLSSLIDIEKIKNYDKLIFIFIIILFMIQVWIIRFLYVPSYKLGKFKWDIE